MSQEAIKIQYFPKPPVSSGNGCGMGGCGSVSGKGNSSCGCTGGGCIPQRDINAVYKELSQNYPQKYECLLASYETKEEIDKAIANFNTIMEKSEEKVRAKDVNEMFKYLIKYAPLMAINDHLVYIQNTPAASHIEHAVNSYFK